MNVVCRIKVCKTCKVPKELDDFPTYNSRHHGILITKPICRECIKIREQKYKENRRKNDPVYKQRELDRNKSYREKYSDGYKLHIIKKRETNKNLYYTDLETRLKKLYASCRSRASKRGMDFDLTPATLYVMVQCQELKCSVTGVPFDLGSHSDYHKKSLRDIN